MCGIAGFYHARVDQSKISEAFERLRHRGPDGHRAYLRDDVGLIHTRLAIIELSDAGSQPWVYENLVLVYNGELYNYKEIREELKSKGYSFTSNADSEVLIKAFHCFGESCVDRFIGMFAFAVYDEQKDEIHLFRDRMGVKPLYYSFENGSLYFASELSALLVFPVTREINMDAVSLYFRFGFIPRDLSIYKSVSRLEPGHFVRISKNGLTKKKYWTMEGDEQEGRSEDSWLDELDSLMTSAFRYRMVSDVPVGIFLSGGMDSSLLAAILRKHHGSIHTFTIGFEEQAFDESKFAREVAGLLKTEHHEKVLTVGEAKDLFLDFYSIYDEPFADTSGIAASCVARLAKENGAKVVLSADGGDELFGGYPHYVGAERLFNMLQAWPTWLRKAVSAGTRAIVHPKVRERIYPFNTEHKVYALEEVLNAENPNEFFEAYVANQAGREVSNMMNGSVSSSIAPAAQSETMLKTMTSWDLRYFLPDDLLVKMDRATMYHGIECREPFLDHRLVEFSQRLPGSFKIRNGTGKYLLRKLLGRYLPERLFERKKQGFSIPIFSWFSSELDSMFHEYLNPEKLKAVPFLDSKEIVKEHRKYLYYKKLGRQYNIEKMWRILSFMLWWNRHCVR